MPAVHTGRCRTQTGLEHSVRMLPASSVAVLVLAPGLEHVHVPGRPALALEPEQQHAKSTWSASVARIEAAVALGLGMDNCTKVEPSSP